MHGRDQRRRRLARLGDAIAVVGGTAGAVVALFLPAALAGAAGRRGTAAALAAAGCVAVAGVAVGGGGG